VRSSADEPSAPQLDNRVAPDELGLRHADEHHVRDLWTHTSTVKSGDVQAWVPHAARMFLASPG
jgi:hypothetical protein